jgi:hypothetical protein
MKYIMTLKYINGLIEAINIMQNTTKPIAQIQGNRYPLFMKKTLVLTSLLSILSFTSIASAHDHGHGHGGVNFDFGFGYYPGYYPGWCSRPVYYASPVYYGPGPAVYAEPVYSQPVVQTVTTPQTTAPYGYLVSQGMAKSPWSDFAVSTGGRASGQVVYDANNGKPFRIP